MSPGLAGEVDAVAAEAVAVEAEVVVVVDVRWVVAAARDHRHR
jgi:hypothetical protein